MAAQLKALIQNRIQDILEHPTDFNRDANEQLIQVAKETNAPDPVLEDLRNLHDIQVQISPEGGIPLLKNALYLLE